MDYVRLVENGIYKKEELNEKNKSFIEGMEFVLNELKEGFYNDSDFLDDFSPTIAQMKQEIAGEVVEDIKEWIYVTICEMIVMSVDNQPGEGEDEE